MSADLGAARIIFIRHGRSDWNIHDRFTGWTDIDLDRVGIEESAAAGCRLVKAGLGIDEIHVSALKRTHQTAQALCKAAGWSGVPICEDWRLNERHYGALQGMAKPEIFAAWGEAASRRWWRGYTEPPPALDPTDPRHPVHDPKYRHLPPGNLPASESLRDCQRRALSCWTEALLPPTLAGRHLLVVSHGNTLRGLIMHLDQISPDDMERVEIPPAVPLIYRLDPDGTIISREWLD